MRVLIATDAWYPQVNGVVRSLEAVAREAPALGADITFLTPEGFRGIPLPTYPDIRLALASPGEVARRIEAARPDVVHVATEGPVGFLVRRACLKAGRPFTTGYHTRFPEYLAARAPVPVALGYAFLRRFHNTGAGTMVATAALEHELAARGFRRLMRWSRGVDTGMFRPRPEADLGLPRPVFLTVSRIAVEKNLDGFLRLDLPGTKVVVGDGPARAELQRRFPDAVFLGLRQGEDLAGIYAAADVFVFPSRTDTFGIVLLEALASGLPVAAFPEPGPIDVIGDAGPGVLSDDLREAAIAALATPREAARARASRFSWRASAEQFIANLRASEAASWSKRVSVA